MSSAARRRSLGRERTRRWRDNAMAGRMVVDLVVEIEDAEALIAMKCLSSNDTDSREAMAAAVKRLLRVLHR
jgi:hypothetical protein